LVWLSDVVIGNHLPVRPRESGDPERQIAALARMILGSRFRGNERSMGSHS
jgi:hypothetical protein